MDTIRLDPKQKKKAAKVFASAFYNYPMFTFYFPDQKKRDLYFEWYMGKVINCALRYGEVYVTPDLSGAVNLLLPDHTTISTWEYIRSGFLLSPIIFGIRRYSHVMECEEYVTMIHEKIMKEKPHYYIWGLVVDPAQQRKGIGASLMKPILERADLEKKPIYLETHDEKNVDYYKRMGFDLVQTALIPEHGLHFWCMVREPR